MRRVWAHLLHVFLVLACSVGGGQAADCAIGIRPIHSMRTLAERFEPLRAYLERRLSHISSFIALAEPGITRGRALQLRDLLLAFSLETAGREFLQGIAFEKFVPADASLMQRVDAYLGETRRGLQR